MCLLLAQSQTQVFFLSPYVDVAYAFFGAIVNIFPCLETILRPRMYLIKLASACPLSHRSPSLSTFPNTFFKFGIFIAKTTETLFNGFRVLPNLILLLISLCIFFQKITQIEFCLMNFYRY